MSEERLRSIVRDGLESLPLPSRFESPSSLVTARKPWRRSLLIVAAAAACLTLALAFSPVGSAVVRAVSARFITDFQVQEPLESQIMPEWMKQLATLKPGDTLEVPPENGVGPRHIYRAVTFAEAGRTWPLPVYRAPDPQARVLLYTATNANISIESVQLGYTVTVGKTEYKVFYNYHVLPPEMQAAPETMYGSASATREKVQIKGQEALAVSEDGGKNWRIEWRLPSGLGEIRSDLPLDELVKIIESIPNL